MNVLRRHFVPLAFPLILAVSFAVYWPSMDSSFHLDDRDTIVENNLCTMQVMELARKYPTRSLVFLTFKLQEHIGDRSLVAYHAVNIATHALNAWLVLVLTRLLWRPMRRHGCGSLRGFSPRWMPLAAGLLFAVHPLGSQAVIYITQRFTLAGTLCILLALVSVARGYLPGRSIALGWTLAFVAMLAGAFCKEIVIAAPVLAVCMVCVLIAPQKLRVWRFAQWMRATVVVLVLSAVPIVMFLHLCKWDLHVLMVNIAGVGGPLDAHVPGLTRWSYALTQAQVVIRYLLLVLFPAGLQIDPDVPLIRVPWSPTFIVSCAIVAASLAGAWRLRLREPMVLWGTLVFFIALLPQSSFMPTPDLMFEHRAYLSIAGAIWAALGLVHAVCMHARRSLAPRIAAAMMALVFLVLSMATYARSMVWHDEFSLWRDAYQKAPEKQRVVVNYVNALIETGKIDEALDILELKMNTWNRLRPELLAQLANAYARAGRPEEAIRAAEAAFDADPSNPAIRFNLAVLCHGAGKTDDALRHIDDLLRIAPEYADGYYLSGALRSSIPGQNHVATNHLHQYLVLQPRGIRAHETRLLIQAIERNINQP